MDSKKIRAKDFEKVKEQYRRLVFQYLPNNKSQVFYYDADIHNKVMMEIFSKNREMLDIGENIITANLLADNEYIDNTIPPIGDMYSRMTDKGINAKKLGGHEKYLKFERQQLNINNYQRKVNWALIFIGLLSILVPTIFELDKHYHFMFKDGSSQVRPCARHDSILVPIQMTSSPLVEHDTLPPKKLILRKPVK